MVVQQERCLTANPELVATALLTPHGKRRKEEGSTARRHETTSASYSQPVLRHCVVPATFRQMIKHGFTHTVAGCFKEHKEVRMTGRKPAEPHVGATHMNLQTSDFSRPPMVACDQRSVLALRAAD